MVAPVITLATTPGITYSISGDVLPGETVTVTATAEDGIRLVPATGWVIADDENSATLEITLDEPACDQPVTLVSPTVVQGVCQADGSVTAPSITLADTTGITYVITGTVELGQTVLVTATAQTGYYLPDTAGWVLSDDAKSATQVIVLDNVPCATPRTPVNPTVAQPVCQADGTASAPSITFATNEGITYSIDGDVVPGATVLIRATALYGNRLEQAEGWVLSDDGLTATTRVTLADPDCDAPVTPVAPIVIQATCMVDGSMNLANVTLATTEGIVYSISGEVAAGNTITVTAVAQDGYYLPATEGWVSTDDKTATREIVLDEVNCPEQVTPVLPTVEQQVCVDGDLTNPTVTLGTTAGIIYSIEGEVEAGNTVTVTATTEDGNVLTPVDGWKLDTETYRTATLEVVLTKVEECSDSGGNNNENPGGDGDTDTPGDTTGGGDKDDDKNGHTSDGKKDEDRIAETGGQYSAIPLLVGLGLLTTGAGLLFIRRRKTA